MIAALRAWLCRSMLDELETRHDQELVDVQRTSYEIGHAAGFSKGVVVGQLQGQNMLAEKLNGLVDERHGEYVTPADIERARKGILH